MTDEFSSTRLDTGEELEVGMRIFSEIDDFYNTDACTITAVDPSRVGRNIRVVTSRGDVRSVSIWQVRSTLPTSTDVADIVAWVDA